MVNKISIAVLITFSMSSCIFDFSEEHKLPEEAHTAIPYEGSEILVFKSDKGDLATVSIKGSTVVMTRGGDGLTGNPDSYENININYTSPSYPKEQSLVYIGFFGNSYDYSFEFNVGHSKLFLNKSFSKEQFNELENTTLRVSEKEYTDVKVLHSEPYYTDRAETIINFYWSESSGLIGWDTQTVQWRIENME